MCDGTGSQAEIFPVRLFQPSLVYTHDVPIVQISGPPWTNFDQVQRQPLQDYVVQGAKKHVVHPLLQKWC